MVRLYELKNPNECKFGGDLNQYEKARLVKSFELPKAWEPYMEKPASIENICGKFVRIPAAEEREEGWNIAEAGPPLGYYDQDGDKAVSSDISQVCFKKYSPFGSQTEVYHLRGHVTVRNAPGLPKSVSFKGVRGYSAAKEIVGDMMYPEDTTGVAVHMAVIGLNLGRRLQTSPGCYLENRVRDSCLSFLEVGSRTIDTCNTVRVVVCDWGAVGLEEKLRPTSNDVLITGKGSFMHRYTWKSLEWTEENEARVLAASQWVADHIAYVV
jgi:hypothetical protein